MGAFIAGIGSFLVNLFTSKQSGHRSIGVLIIVIWDIIMVILALEMFLRHYRA